jgi:hypothetical protein
MRVWFEVLWGIELNHPLSSLHPRGWVMSIALKFWQTYSSCAQTWTWVPLNIYGRRSLAYMRPLAIWAMQWALYPPKSIAEAPRVPSMDRGSAHVTHDRFSNLAHALRSTSLPQLRKTHNPVSYLLHIILLGGVVVSTIFWLQFGPDISNFL